MKRNNYTAAVAQMSMTEDAEENLQKAVALIEEAARSGAGIVCLPELFRSRYFCQREDAGYFDLAEPIPGPTTEALAKTAARLEIVVVASVFERRAAGIYHNTAVVIDADGKLAGMYRKMHIPDDPHYHEKFFFTPGDLGFRVFDTRVGRIGTLICWDQWYPEAARLVALQGADILFYPTAIGWLADEKASNGAAQRDAWRTVQRGHAIANGLYVAAANRIGMEIPAGENSGIEFWGSSFIADPQGVLVAESGMDEEGVILTEIDLKHMEDVRRDWPFLRDRRIDAFSGLSSRYLDEAESGS